MERGGAYNRPFEILRLRESTLASRSLALHIDRTFDQPCEGGKLNLSIRRVELSERRAEWGQKGNGGMVAHPFKRSPS